MLHAADSEWMTPYKSAGARVIPVTKLDDFPAVAAALSDALFEGDRHVAR